MKITVLAGDGIGIEVTREAVKVLNEVADIFGLHIETVEQLIGGAAIREKGLPFPEETKQSCRNSNAVLLGAIASVAMLFRYTAKNEEAAEAIENAIEKVLAEGYRTLDISNDKTNFTKTDEIGNLVAKYAVELANMRYAFHAV